MRAPSQMSTGHHERGFSNDFLQEFIRSALQNPPAPLPPPRYRTRASSKSQSTVGVAAATGFSSSTPSPSISCLATPTHSRLSQPSMHNRSVSQLVSPLSSPSPHYQSSPSPGSPRAGSDGLPCSDSAVTATQFNFQLPASANRANDSGLNKLDSGATPRSPTSLLTLEDAARTNRASLSLAGFFRGDLVDTNAAASESDSNFDSCSSTRLDNNLLSEYECSLDSSSLNLRWTCLVDSRASRCAESCLQLIYAFLPVPEMVTGASLVCKYWHQAAALDTNIRKESVSIDSVSQTALMINSASLGGSFLRHISDMRLTVTISLKQLLVLSNITNLIHSSVAVRLDESILGISPQEMRNCSFPALTTLSFNIREASSSLPSEILAQCQQRCLDYIACQNSLQQLGLRLFYALRTHFSLSAFRSPAVPQLKILHLENAVLTHQMCMDVRCLSNKLEEFLLRDKEWDVASLGMLLPSKKQASFNFAEALKESVTPVSKSSASASPASSSTPPTSAKSPAMMSPKSQRLRLRALNLNETALTGDHMQHLLTLKNSLTCLTPETVTQSVFHHLAHFKKLENLKLIVPSHEGDPLNRLHVNSSALTPYLFQCSALTQLELSRIAFRQEDAILLFRSLSKLKILALRKCMLPNLHVFIHAKNLQCLTLQACEGVLLSEIENLNLCENLKSVQLMRTVITNAEAGNQQQFDRRERQLERTTMQALNQPVPSAFFPNLEKLVCHWN